MAQSLKEKLKQGLATVKGKAKEAIDISGKVGKTILKGGAPVLPPQKEKFEDPAKNEFKRKNARQFALMEASED